MAASTDEATGDRERTDEVRRDPTRVGTGKALLGGVLGGVVGTTGFGLLSMALGLGFVRSFIPALFGLGQSGVVGWTVHLATGAVLGLGFGAVVSRDAVRAILAPEGPEPILGPVDVDVRAIGAAVAYGLAIWALLPMLVLPVWLGTVDVAGVDAVPGSGLPSLLAHLVFGLLLGVTYALVTRR